MSPVTTSISSYGYSINFILSRVAMKIFEGFGEVLFKEFIIGQELLSVIHYTRPGTCINHQVH